MNTPPGCLIVEIKDYRQPAAAKEPSKQPSPAKPELPSKASLAGRLEGGRYGAGPVLQPVEKDGTVRTPSGDNSLTETGLKTPTAQGPETYRVVLYPNEGTLWTELRSLNERLSGGAMSEEEGLQAESKILALTSAPLCLTPDTHVARIANLMLAATAPASKYLSSRNLPHQRSLPPIEPRGIALGKKSADQSDVNDQQIQRQLAEARKREALMKLMEGGWRMAVKDKKLPGRTAQAQLPNSLGPAGERPFTPTFHRLAFIEKYRSRSNPQAASAGAAPESGSGGSKTQSGGEADSSAAVGSSASAPVKGEDAKANGNVNGSTTKKVSSKKRKKQDTEGSPAEEKEEASAGPKSKKKKPSAPSAGNVASKTQDKNAGAKSADTSATSPPSKGSKAKAMKAKKAPAGKSNNADSTGDTSMNAGSPINADAPTPSANGDGETGAKSGKRPPASKKTPAKGSKKATQSQSRQASVSQQSNGTPALHNAHLPTGSPMRQAAASPYGMGAMASPSPAMSHQGIPQGNFGNLPFGIGIPGQSQSQPPGAQSQQQQQQHQQAAAAIAAHFGLPLGVGLPPGMQMGQGGQPGPGIPFGLPHQAASQQQPLQQQQQQQHAGGLSLFNAGQNLPGSQQQQQQQQQQLGGVLSGLSLNNTNPDAMAQTVSSIQSHPGFHNLPAHVQQQVLAFQRNASQNQGQPPQQGQQLGVMGGSGVANAGNAGNMFPPGWPMTQR